jgi:hypothetical protein
MRTPWLDPTRLVRRRMWLIIPLISRTIHRFLLGRTQSTTYPTCSVDDKWVPARCAAGYRLDFRRYPNFTHMGVLERHDVGPEIVDLVAAVGALGVTVAALSTAMAR